MTRSLSLNVDLDDDMAVPRVAEIREDVGRLRAILAANPATEEQDE
jgi:hypothetical protein